MVFINEFFLWPGVVTNNTPQITSDISACGTRKFKFVYRFALKSGIDLEKTPQSMAYFFSLSHFFFVII